jgi:hypothetical protein
MIILKTLFTIPGITFISSACKKDNLCPQLPPITMKGACTFGCRVQREFWLAGKKSDGSLDNLEGGIVGRYKNDCSVNTGYFDFLLLGKQLSSSSIQFKLSRINYTGVFFMIHLRLLYPMCTQYESYRYINHDWKEFTSLNIVESNVSLLRYDTLNLIFSGTISFIGISQYGKDSIRVTGGRYDIDMKKN